MEYKLTIKEGKLHLKTSVPLFKWRARMYVSVGNQVKVKLQNVSPGGNIHKKTNKMCDFKNGYSQIYY